MKQKKQYQIPVIEVIMTDLSLEVLAHSWNPGGGNYPEKPWDPHGDKPHHTKENNDWEIFGE